MVLLHQRFQRASRRNKDFSGRGASPSAPCMTWFSLLFSSFFLSLSFLGARSQQPPAPRRQPEFQQIRAVFCWGIFVVAGAAGFVLCVLILHVAEGFASADATKGHENKRSLRSPFGNLRRRHFWGYPQLTCPFSWINTRKQCAVVTNPIARKGQGRNSLVGSRGNAPWVFFTGTFPSPASRRSFRGR